MGKLVVTEYMTLDGFMDEPGLWSFPFWNEEAAKFKFDELFASDALLLGRVTYEGFAKAWPSVTDEQGFADRMNNMPKYVVSTTLKEANWSNTQVISANVADEVAKLKQQSGQDILVAGSGELLHTVLAPHGLVDEYRIMLYPFLLGSGKRRLFREGKEMTLKLAHAQTTSTGITILTYHPAAKETA